MDATTSASVPASAEVPKIKKAKIEIPSEENPSLYDICLCTQQALESHIKLDRKEKLEMMIELNLLHNYARQALLYEKEQKKRSWTLLRKHYTRKQLLAKGIKTKYDYLEQFEVPQFKGKHQCSLSVLLQLTCSLSDMMMKLQPQPVLVSSSLIIIVPSHQVPILLLHASASTIARPPDSDSLSGFNSDSEDTPEE